MNIALQLARVRYIARVDQDDLIAPRRLELQAEFLDANEDVTAIGSQVEHFMENDSISQMPLEDARIRARFLSGFAYFANQSSMIRTRFCRDSGVQYDVNLYVVDDLGLWFDSMLHGACFTNLGTPLTRYRVHRPHDVAYARAHTTSRREEP